MAVSKAEVMVDRSLQPITDAHLHRLGVLAGADLADRCTRRPRRQAYRQRIVAVVLCQGAAQHYLDGRNGVKDLDVWTFFAEIPGEPFPPRWRTADFGPSSLGRRAGDPDYRGRRVDLLGRSLTVPPESDPITVIRAYLRGGHTASAKALATKAAVGIDPPEYRGSVIWPA